MICKMCRFSDFCQAVTEIWPKIEKNQMMTLRSRSSVKVTAIPNLNTYMTYHILRYKSVRFCSEYTQIWPTQILNFDDLDLLDVKVNDEYYFIDTSHGNQSLRQAIYSSCSTFFVSPRSQYMFVDIDISKFSDLWPIWHRDRTKLKENEI